jgi:hypothetical protein
MILGDKPLIFRWFCHTVPEHVLLCFCSRDPQVSLESVAQGPDAEMDEATQVDVQDTVKLVAAWFEHQAEDA